MAAGPLLYLCNAATRTGQISLASGCGLQIQADHELSPNSLRTLSELSPNSLTLLAASRAFRHFLLVIAAAYFGAGTLCAQTCTPTPTPTPSPTCTPITKDCQTCRNEDEGQSTEAPVLELIPTEFQPPDGTKLGWRRYVPTGTGPFYTIVVIHGGGFYKGSPFEGGVQQVCQDLRVAGYHVLSVTYRLAPCNTITDQPCHDAQHPESGRPPEQTDDIKSLVRAAGQDSLCNGHVAVLGGSAGASHAAFVSFDKTPSPANTYPNWCQNGRDDRPEVAICLSGPYDFPDRDDTLTRQNFINDVENYTNTCIRIDTNGPIDQKRFSPVAKIKSEGQQSFKPLFAVNGDDEAMPPHQLEDLRCVLVGKNINASLYKTLLLVGQERHAFGLWLEYETDDEELRVRDDVLAFLEDHFKNPP